MADQDNTVLDAQQPLAPVQPQQLPAVAQSSGPMRLLEIAVQRGASVDELEKLMALAERHDRNVAEKAFNAAKSAFSAEPITIIKDKENKQYGSMYTSIGTLVNTVRPFLGKHGLAADWDFNQTNGIEVTCILKHALGHSERVTLKVPPDTSGAKNPLQQIKSSITYARSATFEAVCGLASSADSNMDDDGNGSGVSQDERQELQGAAREMRQGRNRPSPADVASRGRQAAPADTTLLADAQAAADKGHAHFGPYWRSLLDDQRQALAGELSALQQRASQAGGK